MSWRTVVLGGRCKLDYRMGYMVVRGLDTKRVFLNEVNTLVLESTSISLTGSLIEALTERKIKVIFCDSKHNPVSELVPHHGCHNSSEKLQQQLKWTEEHKRLVWQLVVREKLTKQAQHLNAVGCGEEGVQLLQLAAETLPGDPANREGLGAQLYFRTLYGTGYSRGMDCPVNSALNYGYSMIMSAVSREIAAEGYLTQLGIKHINGFNHFNLSCDLMEPFRILVDAMVYKMAPVKFETEEKHRLWGLLADFIEYDGERRAVTDVIALHTRALLRAIETGETADLTTYKFAIPKV